MKREKGRLVFISNVQAHISEEVKKRQNYLKPREQDHFVWAQLESVFDIDTRKGTFANKLLDDFRSALRINGMRGREIVGAKGSIYTKGSPAQQLVLDQYQDMLRKLGWKAWRARKENTLRVNPENHGQDPLFNPRFYATGEWLDPSFIKECDMIHCWAYPTDIRKKLRKMGSVSNKFPEVKFVPALSGGWLAGHLYVPFKFLHAKGGYKIDWIYMGKIWEEMLRILNGK